MRKEGRRKKEVGWDDEEGRRKTEEGKMKEERMQDVS